jgi:hypothetical protein
MNLFDAFVGSGLTMDGKKLGQTLSDLQNKKLKKN